MILKSELEIYDCIGTGSFSDVYRCAYNNGVYAYKKYIPECPLLLIKDKILYLKEYNDKSILFPIDLVFNKKKYYILEGMLFQYYTNYYNLDFYECVSNEEKINILKLIRKLLDYFHTEYKMVHADINPGNFLYNEFDKSVKMIDLDASIDMKNHNTYVKSFSNIFTNNYISLFGIDYDLDIYLFNLLTISFLKNIEFYKINKTINIGNISFDNNHIDSIVNDYKDIKFKKSLKKEYIIDYM